jgi:asparagine synthase (glutamine-hydrolysing)
VCGITGIVPLAGTNVPLDRLDAMAETLVHRGPDGAYRHDAFGVGLAMRRLAIIDVEGGAQPYFDETGSIRAVFNGEIYNFRELREDLETRGHRFASHTDGEVIPHLWEEHGEAFVERLNGMFAIALHDARRGVVLLARDRIGIKPLYYALSPKHLVFGSELKSLLASGLVERRLDVDALGQLLAWEYVPAPATLLVGVHKLRPSETLLVDLRTGASRSRRYWDLPPPEVRPSVSAGEWGDRIEESVGRAVRRQMVSDVPLGAFLSGGVDSSLVVAMMGDARAFSIAFDDPTYDESPWARRVAAHLGVRHRVETIRPDVAGTFDRLMRHMDDPIGDFSIFPTFLVSRLAREEVTVVLSGDGGDEVFGGYETYAALGREKTWNRIPGLLRKGALEPAIDALRPTRAKKGLVNKAKRFVAGARLDPAMGHARWRIFLDDAAREGLFTADALSAISTPAGAHIVELAARAGSRDAVDRALYVDLFSYLPENCLAKVDRMSMAVSLEGRVPLLDHEVVELAFSAPSSLKVRGAATKILLKEVAARRVPRKCVYRRKEGFSIPIKNWLGGELRPLMEDLLSPAHLAEQGLFRTGAVERLKREHLEGAANHSHVLWTLMVFQDWRRRWGV